MNQPSTTGDPYPYYPHHHCNLYPCPHCNPNYLIGMPQPADPAPQIIFQPTGCICPPTSEQTCQNEYCPRKSKLGTRTVK